MRPALALILLPLAACTGPSDTDDADDSPTDGPTDTEVMDTDVSLPCDGAVPPTSGLVARATEVSFRSERVFTGRTFCLVVDDLDRDGHVDIAFVQPGSAAFEVRYGTGTPRMWDTVQTPISLGGDGGGSSCTVVDADADGDLDVLLGTDVSVDRLAADGRAWTHTADVVVYPESFPQSANTATSFLTLIDLDGAPPLDLIVGMGGTISEECVAADEGEDTGDVTVPLDAFEPGTVACFEGRSDGTWVHAPQRCPDPMLTDASPYPYGTVVTDLDADGRNDVIVVNDFAPNAVFRGIEGGLERLPDLGLESYNHAMGVGFADFDLDGRKDAYISDIGPDSLWLARTCTQWFDVGQAHGLWADSLRTITWGVVAADLDHNGAPDIATAMSVEVEPGGFGAPTCTIDGRELPRAPTLVWLNDGTAHFERHDVVDGTGPGRDAYFAPELLAHGDLDGDGDVDLVLATRDDAVVLRNETGLVGKAVRIDVRDGRGLPALGARVVLRHADGAWQRYTWPTVGTQGHSEQVWHVGVGSLRGPFEVAVTWADGTRGSVDDVQPGDVVVVTP